MEREEDEFLRLLLNSLVTLPSHISSWFLISLLHKEKEMIYSVLQGSTMTTSASSEKARIWGEENQHKGRVILQQCEGEDSEGADGMPDEQ
jgi:hypothetical protein